MVVGLIKDLLGLGEIDRTITECVACESKDFTIIGKDTYRCNTCHHEGGEGYAEFKAQQRKEQFLTLGEKEKKIRVAELLNEAKVEFKDCLYNIENPDQFNSGVMDDYDNELHGLEEEEVHFLNGKKNIEEILLLDPAFFSHRVTGQLTAAMNDRTFIFGHLKAESIKKIVKILEQYS